MLSVIRNFFDTVINGLFGNNKKIKIGLYGPPNSGKTTLANRVCADLTNSDEKIGEVSSIAHETRIVGVREELTVNIKGRSLKFDLVDTPGIATRIDYEKFMKSGMSEKESKTRAREATRGVIESIKWLENVDMVVIVLDSTKNPYTQVNLTIIGNLEARKVRTLIVANKTDLKSSKISKIQEAFPKYKVVGISAKFSNNMEEFYTELMRLSKCSR